jgi:hypothetical protein
MEIGAAKVGAKVVQKTGGQPAHAGKPGPSKFDTIRADLRQQLLDKAKLPPKISEIAPQQKKLLENDLRRRLQEAAPQSPKELFKSEISTARTGLDKLNQAIAKIPQHEAFSPLRERLKSIEKDFAATNKAISNPKALDSPEALLDMQQKLYGVTQNIEVLSEVVNQVDSGIKTVMQTQV